LDATLSDAIFALGPHVRYVAFGSGQDVELAQRDDPWHAVAACSS
jgi:hypothetical protein